MAVNEKIVTDELVFQIADQVTASGGRVSNRVIWSELGGGSMTTISAALRRWRERQSLQAEQPIERAPLPESIASAMQDAIARLWKSAQDETQKELDSLAQTMNERISAAGVERDEALAELQLTAEELEAAQTRLEELESNALDAQNQVMNLNGLLTDATEQLAASASRVVVLGNRVEDLKNELERVRADHQKEVERLQAEIDRARETTELAVKRTGELEALRALVATLAPNAPPAKPKATK